ncbi:MAG TPA: Pr6Pr family membrane protein [Flavobacterium sp.]|nr:Pr6Pr family membrane protein [Flavobacterium sp.]
MKTKITFLFAAISWFALIAQYILMIGNREAGLIETSVRFVSFFTILTNTLVACYFTSMLSEKAPFHRFFSRPSILTALTVYITVVCLVYQLVLRAIWTPTGLQMVVNELLHSVIPLEVIFFWYLYESKKQLNFSLIGSWLLFPAAYLVYILIRGHFSGFYPYPFVNVTELGMQKVLLHSALLMLVFVFFSVLFIAIGKSISKSPETAAPE